MWSVEGYDREVAEYVVMDTPELLRLIDVNVLKAKSAERQREAWEPTTYDFVPSASRAMYRNEQATIRALYKHAQSAIEEANRTFEFHIDRWQQPLRLNVYGEGHEFKWHTDYTLRDNSKLALVHMIQKAESGGELQLILGARPVQVSLEVGQTIVFPAYIYHRVTTIEKGQRIVLAAWATGDRFR